MAIKFTSDELLVLHRMGKQNASANEIAKVLPHRDISSIRVKCKSVGIALRSDAKHYDSEHVAAIRTLAAQGWSANAVAKQLGRTPLSVRVKACAIGVSFRLPRGDDQLTFKVDAKTRHYLQRAAEARGVHVGQLMRQALFQIVERDLINAIMAGTFKPTTAVTVKSKPNAATNVPTPTPSPAPAVFSISQMMSPELFGRMGLPTIVVSSREAIPAEA